MHVIDKRIKTLAQSLVRSALWLGITLIVFCCLVKLSLWQYGRGFEKEQRMERIFELNQKSPLTLNEVVKLSSEKQFISKESINDFPVSIKGDFDKRYTFLLDNQVEAGSLGYRVLQVVQTPAYSVLVNLGWVQGSLNRSILPELKPLQGHHEFQGHVRIVEQGIVLKPQNFTHVLWPLRVQQINLATFSKLVNKPLLPFVVYVDPKDNLGYKKNWHPMVMPADKHFGYAFQWASLAIAWLILMICLRIKTQHPANKQVANVIKNKEVNNNKKQAAKYG